jgi:hypothetical protein
VEPPSCGDSLRVKRWAHTPETGFESRIRFKLSLKGTPVDLATILLMPPLLLAQQITTTISTRAKNSDSVWYCGVASFMAHLAWAISNSFALWKVGREFSEGVTWIALFSLAWYAIWGTAGNLLGWRLARSYERRQ